MSEERTGNLNGAGPGGATTKASALDLRIQEHSLRKREIKGAALECVGREVVHGHRAKRHLQDLSKALGFLSLPHVTCHPSLTLLAWADAQQGGWAHHAPTPQKHCCF